MSVEGSRDGWTEQELKPAITAHRNDDERNGLIASITQTSGDGPGYELTIFERSDRGHITTMLAKAFCESVEHGKRIHQALLPVIKK